MADLQKPFLAPEKSKKNAEEENPLADAPRGSFDPNIPQPLRAGRILKETGNPYSFQIDGLKINLEFSDSAPTLQDLFSSFLIRKKAGCSYMEKGGGFYDAEISGCP